MVVVIQGERGLRVDDRFGNAQDLCDFVSGVWLHLNAPLTTGGAVVLIKHSWKCTAVGLVNSSRA